MKNRNALFFIVTTLALISCTIITSGQTLAPIGSATSPAPALPAATPAVSDGYTPSPVSSPLPSPPPGTMPSAGSLDLPLTVRETLGIARVQEPVTSGVPIPRNLNLTNLSPLRLLDASGKPIAAQFIPLARWGGAPDDAEKPVRWLLLDFQATVAANATTTYHLRNTSGAMPTYPTLTVIDGAEAVTINTGAAQFSLSKLDGNLTAPHLTAPIFAKATDTRGADYATMRPVTVTVATSGPMRVSVQVKGAFRKGDIPLLHHTTRYWFYAGQPTVRLFHTVENDNLCPLTESEQLNCFDIGSGGSVNIRDLSLVLPTNLGGTLQYQVGTPGISVSGALTADLLLYQDSSGTDSWNRYPTFTDWQGQRLDTHPRMQSYVTFRGYRATLGNTTINTGDQAAGWLSISGQNGTWTVGVRDFWQNFPKALRASPDGTLQIALFPDEFGPADYAFNLRAGEHKTHEVLLSYAGGQGCKGAGANSSLPCSPAPLLPRLFAQAPPAWYVDSGAFGLTALPNTSDWLDHEQYIEHQLTTAPNHDRDDYFKNLPDAIEKTDFYGIFDYGDWPIDYEGFEVAPLNLKYYNDYGMWLQWARTGDARWFTLAQAADRHFADIDILHNHHTPRHWSDGIIFGHSEHDEPGFTNPHRNRNSGSTDTAYGVTGMFLAYYLTGYEQARDSALELSDCIEWRLRNDEHLRKYFADDTGAGYALDEGLYENGSRLAANSLDIAVAAYRATADPRYLQVADAVVDWARPAVQPYINNPRLESMGVVNGPIAGDERMEKPWLLNLYLRALADYLEMRGEFGLPDAYNAKESFLAYANWLRTYAWLDLPPLDTSPRAAYPYEWWFDGRRGIEGEDNDNGDPSINNWLLLGADVMAYAYHLSGDADYLARATRLFRTGSRDPWYEGDANFYAESKETVNSITFGHIFLHEWARRR